MSLVTQQLVQYLMDEFARLFPGHADQTPLVRNAICARMRRFEAVFAFYDNHCGDGVSPRPRRIVEMCERAFRDALADEFNKVSDSAGFMLRNYIRMNRQKTQELLLSTIQSDAVAAVVTRYPFITPMVVEASTPEWLSSRLDL